jgi:hypothetical protein
VTKVFNKQQQLQHTIFSYLNFLGGNYNNNLKELLNFVNFNLRKDIGSKLLHQLEHWLREDQNQSNLIVNQILFLVDEE